MNAHYPGNMDSEEKVTGRQSAAGLQERPTPTPMKTPSSVANQQPAEVTHIWECD